MAVTANAIEAGLYLYGITVAQGAVPVEIPGIENAEVEQVVEGSLAAIVTRVTTEKIRPQRSNLAAHHHVLRDLTEQRPILPIHRNRQTRPAGPSRGADFSVLSERYRR